MTHDHASSGPGPGEPFALRDCSLLGLATGRKASNLRELCDHIRHADRASIYHHFWGRLLHTQFVEQEYNNDFASWVHRELGEKALAERLAMVNPVDFPDIDALREEVVDILEERLDEGYASPWSPRDGQFHFLRSIVVVIDTGRRVEAPARLAQLMPALATGSVFYHFIDARRRTPVREDDFSAWLRGYGDKYQKLRERLAAVDPYFCSIGDLRSLLARIVREHLEEESDA